MKLPIGKIKSNPDNPRLIKDDNFKKLVQSLKDFPEMAEVREVVLNKDNMILGGNMRFRAMKEAGWKNVPVRIVDWPIEKQREFIIKDNASHGNWDWDALANKWDMSTLEDWGVGLANLGDFNKIGQVNDGTDEWVGMPEFEGADDAYRIVISFEKESERQEFTKTHDIKQMNKESKTWSMWWPYREKDDVSSLRYE